MYGTLNLWPLQPAQLWRLRHPPLWAGPSFDPDDEIDLCRYAILRLPERERDVFVLSRFRGLTYSDIARRLKIEPAAVEAHLAAALCMITRTIDLARQVQSHSRRSLGDPSRLKPHAEPQPAGR
jgi:hypothetical protein